MIQTTALLMSLLMAPGSQADGNPLDGWPLPQMEPATLQGALLTTHAPTLNLDVARRAVEATWCAMEKGVSVQKLLVVDLSMNSRDKRLWAFDLSDPANPRLVHHDRVAHGIGSDRDGDGMADSFSNTPDSHQSSLGLYRVAEAYNGVNGGSRRLDGLFQRFNSNARDRAVVMHPSHYVREDHVGRSQGCPAVSYETMELLEDAGLDDAVLWMDAPDEDLDTKVAACADTVREDLIAQAHAQQLDRMVQIPRTWLDLAFQFPIIASPERTPRPLPPAPGIEVVVYPGSRVRLDGGSAFSTPTTRII